MHKNKRICQKLQKKGKSFENLKTKLLLGERKRLNGKGRYFF